MKIVKKFQKFDNKVRKKIGLGFTTKLDNVAHKGFKKVWNNPIGRIVIMAAAIYLGGAALGAWSGPSAWGGAAAGTGGGAGVGGGLGGGALTTGGLGGGVGAIDAALLAGTPAALPAASATFSPALAGIGVGGAGASATSAAALAGGSGAVDVALAGGAGGGGGVGSIVAKISEAATKLGKFAAENKMLTSGAMMMGGQLLQPSQAETDRQAQKRYWSNLNVANINLGLGGAPKEPIKDMRGNPVYDDNGFISRRLAGTPQPVPVNTGANV